MLDHVSTRNILVPIKIHTDWERFQNLASDLISPRIQIHMVVDAEHTARKFAVSLASVYRLSLHKITLSELNEELPEVDCLLRLKQRLRKLWQETRDQARKMAVNWVTKTIRRMTSKKTLER
jgi:hypothetical protein